MEGSFQQVGNHNKSEVEEERVRKGRRKRKEDRSLEYPGVVIPVVYLKEVNPLGVCLSWLDSVRKPPHHDKVETRRGGADKWEESGLFA